MRVTVLSIVPSPYQRDLFAALAARPEVALRVWYAEPSSPDSPWPEAPLRAYETVGERIWLSWGGKRFLVNWKMPDLGDADIIVANGYITLPAQRVLRRVARRKPVLFWGERMVGERTGLKGVVHRWLTRPIGNAAAIVAIGKGAARDYGARWPGKPVYQLPYYCDIDAFRAEIPERPRRPVRLLFCGQMIARKGVDLLLTAFEAVVAAGHDVVLSLVGREAELPQYLAGLGEAARARVEYHGFQSPEALAAYYRAADVFILPSRYDGWGVVVNQALGAGLPVLCSDAVGAAETLVEPGVNGRIFASGDSEALRAAIEEVVGEPGRLAAWAAASARAGERLRPEVGAAQWVEILQQEKLRHNRETTG